MGKNSHPRKTWKLIYLCASEHWRETDKNSFDAVVTRLRCMTEWGPFPHQKKKRKRSCLLIPVEMAFGTWRWRYKASIVIGNSMCYFRGLWIGLAAPLLDSISQYLEAVTIPPSPEVLITMEETQCPRSFLYTNGTAAHLQLYIYAVIFIIALYPITSAGLKRMSTLNWHHTISPGALIMWGNIYCIHYVSIRCAGHDPPLASHQWSLMH